MSTKNQPLEITIEILFSEINGTPEQDRPALIRKKVEAELLAHKVNPNTLRYRALSGVNESKLANIMHHGTDLFQGYDKYHQPDYDVTLRPRKDTWVASWEQSRWQRLIAGYFFEELVEMGYLPIKEDGLVILYNKNKVKENMFGMILGDLGISEEGASQRFRHNDPKSAYIGIIHFRYVK